MKGSHRWPGLLLAGAGSRLAVAGAVILLLWAGFFWATGMPGPVAELFQ